MKRTVLIASMPLVLAAAAACDLEIGHDELEPMEEPLTEVAQAVTDNGDVWTFLEGEPGEMVVWASRSNADHEPFVQLDAQELSYTELYEQLTSQPAPRALQQAQAREDALIPVDPSERDDQINQEGGEELPDGREGIGRVSSQISAAAFQSTYCGISGWDYRYCWPSFYGSPYVQRKTYSMYGYVAAVNNTITFRLRYKTVAAGSWKTLVSAQALPGQVHHVYQRYFGYRRWRRWEVLNNGSNLVRYSVYGSD